MKRIVVVIFLMIAMCIASVASIAEDVEKPRRLSDLQWRTQGDLALALGIREEGGYGVWFYNANLQPLHMLPFPPDQAMIVKWSPDGTRFLMGRDIVDAETFEVISSLPSQSLSLGDWSHDSTQLLAWVDRWRWTWLGFFDVEKGMFIRQIPIKNALGDDSVFWSPDNLYFLRLYPYERDDIVSAEDLTFIAKLDTDFDVISHAWSLDSQYLAGGILSTVDADTPGILPQALPPTLASVIVWDVLTGKTVHKFSPLPAFLRFIVWHPYKPLLVAGSLDGLIYVWNSETGEQLKAFTLEEDLYGLTFSPFGGRLVATTFTTINTDLREIGEEQRKAFPHQDYWSQDTVDGLLKVIVIDPSLENLRDVETACVPADLIAQLPDAETEFAAYIDAVQQNDAIAPGCAADLVAVAEALQDTDTSPEP